MLNASLIEELLQPVEGAAPSGPDLEYDADFLALQTEAQGKPEQQFGDTLIAAVEPDWRKVQTGAVALLRRSKDLRVAVLLLRASTHLDGLPGFQLGLQLISQLLERYWPSLHPALDADDDDDPTMRLNALAPLADEATLLRDLYGVRIGTVAGLGPVSVRDVLIAGRALAHSGETPPLPEAAVQGGMAEIAQAGGDGVEAIRALPALLAQLGALLDERSGRDNAIDLRRLRSVAQHLQAALPRDIDGGGEPLPASEAAEGAVPVRADVPAAAYGEIRSRQDAIQALNRVIHYLQQAEPGNPAPLLIERAKQLIGVSFLEIMANLAPGALETIEMVTGKRADE